MMTSDIPLSQHNSNTNYKQLPSSASSNHHHRNSHKPLPSSSVDDDETDEEDSHRPQHSPNRHMRMEDVCLVCPGSCRCGAAAGASVFAPPARIRSGGLKVRITLSSASAPHSTPTTSNLAHSFATTALGSTGSAARRRSTMGDDSDESDEYSPGKGRSAKKQKIAVRKVSIGATTTLGGGAGGMATPPPAKKRGRPRKYDLPPVAPAPPGDFNSTFQLQPIPSSTLAATKRKSTRPLPTPSRSSLRQVLAASVKSVDPPSIHSSSSYQRIDSMPKQRFDEDLLDSDSSESGSEEEGIMRSEERAMRHEFERGSEDEESDSDSLNEGGSSAWSQEDEGGAGGGEEEEWRKSLRMGSVGDEDGEGEYDDMIGVDALSSGGRGVVTWSDYDSVDESEAGIPRLDDFERSQDRDDEEFDRDVAGEFENELEELFALSEAVVGPVREDEWENGEMWFEEVSESGESEEGEDDEEGDGGERNEARAGRSLVMDRWGLSRSRRNGSSGEGSEDADATDSDDSMDGLLDSDLGGDTTDSLDSDDHVGLIRFGIEVDSSSSSSSSSSPSDDEDDDFFHKRKGIRAAPGTTSLADVQAPTPADLAALPKHLFQSTTSLSSPNGTSSDVATSAKSSIDSAAPSPITIDRPRSDSRYSAAAKGKGRARVQDLRTEETEGDDTETETDRSPAMGVFNPTASVGKSGGVPVVVVIDGSDTVAPSPFSKVKKGRKRLLDGTPSRRMRAASKISTNSARSLTEGSLNGELFDVPSPAASITVNLELDDVLHRSVLHPPSPSSSASSNDLSHLLPPSLSSKPNTTGLSDLSRWNRIPIGAFRSSTTTISSPVPAPVKYFNSTAEEATASFSDRRRKGASGTLYRPATARKEIERRMLLSPVFAPVDSTVNAGTPLSRRTKRMEKRKGLGGSALVEGKGREMGMSMGSKDARWE